VKKTREPLNENAAQSSVNDPCGNVRVHSAEWTSRSDRLDSKGGLQGARLEAAGWLHRPGYRDYPVRPGRWMELDPTGYVDGSSLYHFADGDPVGAVDPTGDVPSTQPSTVPAPGSGTGTPTQPTTAPSIALSIVPTKPTLGASGDYKWSVDWQLDLKQVRCLPKC